MSKKALVPVNIPAFPNDPTYAAVAGDLYYNTTLNTVRAYDGTKWIATGIQASQPLTYNSLQGTLGLQIDGNLEVVGGALKVTDSLQSIDRIYIDTAATPAVGVVGLLQWNDGDGTLDLGVKGGNVTLQIGQEQLVRVYNEEATSLTSGELVYISGAQGNRVAVRRASNTVESGSSATLGMVTETILAGTEGFITRLGVVNKLNTFGIPEGTVLWLGSAAGTYTTTRPTAPNNSVRVGWVAREHATTGSIYVDPQNGFELDELHNVVISSIANGNILIYNSVQGVWRNQPQSALQISNTQVSGLGTAALLNAGDPNGVATLDAGGKVPITQLPATAIAEVFVVASEAEMLALTAQTGDIAIRTDLSKSFILQSTPASTLSNWKELLSPTTIQGTTGPQGTQGVQGPQGTTGIQGAVGLQGLIGADGIQGTQGAQGTQGTDGIQGTEGLQGTQGVQGTQGFHGTQGIQGTEGLQGTIGAQGVEGAQGTQGTQGTDGVQGTTGAQGTDGIQGTQGTQGTQGFHGVTGAQGTQGVQGTDGIQGATGTQGTTGRDGNFGGATFDYTYDISTTASDPGTGKIRFNDTALNGATQMYIDASDDANTNLSSFLTTIDDSTSTIKGHYRVSKKFDSSVFVLFTISSVTDNSGWFTVNGSYVSGSVTALNDAEDVIVTFARTGDRGDVGPQGIQGVQGATGTQGTQGTQGTEGLQGVEGAQGATGTQGAEGTQGVQGVQGPQGVQGVQGTHGTQGTTGIQGFTGIQGAEGTQGTQGVQGVQGTQGIQGSEGLQGVQGTVGSQGLTGIQGLIGTQGTQGVQGFIGLQGVDGSITPASDTPPASPQTGQMWYETSTGYTYIYYDSAWVQFGVGPQGAQGTTGAQGTAGFSGSDGAQGIQGSTGSQGVTGVQGSTGFQGTTGDQGIQGSIGTQGVQGTTGSQGVQGTDGLQGSVGAQGIQGIQGIQGSTGTQGLQGTQGTVGRFVTSDTAPVSPSLGDVWYNTTNGYSYIYYDSQWLQFGVGPQGMQGTTGSQGTSGLDGSQGVQGITGSQGLTGVQGIQGFEGTQGIQGVQGVTGKFETSDTAPVSPQVGDVWYNTTNGYSYIYYDSIWVQFGVGPQGAQGLSGAQGTAGVQGATGTQGSAGYVGSDGAQGTTGAQGATGAQGTAGFVGSDGAQGTQGLQGIQGTTGTQGLTGTQGVTGLQGLQGALGTGAIVIASDTAPATPTTGTFWFKSDTGQAFIYYDSFWVEFATGPQGPAGQASVLRWKKTAVGGETSLSGVDDIGATLSYTAGKELLYLNGVLLVRGVDYSATTGTTITSLSALAANDVVEIIAFGEFVLNSGISSTLIDAKGDLIVGSSSDVAARLAAGANGQALYADSSQTNGLRWGDDLAIMQIMGVY